MRIPILSANGDFPDLQNIHPSGIVALAGELNTETLLKAYGSGIFPWYSDSDPCIIWHCPPERMVLQPGKHVLSKSMQKVFRNSEFELRIDSVFAQIISACATSYRVDQDGTWITTEMQNAYIALHKAGYAHSFEAWQNGMLVGGLYGVSVGSVFCGESMFSHKSNASKFAFISMSQFLAEKNFKLIDCQNHSDHLASLGANIIQRNTFLNLINEYTKQNSLVGNWGAL